MAGFTRRQALAGAATLALPTALRAQSATVDTDVLIVGAGAAGLSAARELGTRRRSFLLVEARERVGGRVFTDRTLGAGFDAGASDIHWAEHNPWAVVARDLAIETVDSDTLPNGSAFYQAGQRSGRGGNSPVWSDLQTLFDTDVGSVPDISFLDRVAGKPDGYAQGASSIARLALGDEPSRISALDYARLWSGTDLVVPSGYGDLVARFGGDIPVRLSTPVSALDWSGPGVVAETTAGRITARTAIVTVPVGVLQAGAIRFSPALPPETRDGIAGLGMGALTKIGLRFEGNRFAVPQGTDLWDEDAPGATYDFECWTYDRDLVIVYCGADHARALVAQGEQGAVASALDRFVSIVGADARGAFRGGRLHGWIAEPYSLGAYSHALPGHADARAKLAAVVGDKIWFAGEATAGALTDASGPAMTAGGAFLAGQQAARAIDAKLAQG